MDICQTDWCTVHGVRCCFTSHRPTDRFVSGLRQRQVNDSAQIKSQLGLTHDILWLNQNHGVNGVDIDRLDRSSASEQITTLNGNRFVAQTADFAWSRTTGTVIAISVADCMPIALFDTRQALIGLCHAGWRGLANHILDKMLREAGFSPPDTLALIGPHICQSCYEVDRVVYQPFVDLWPSNDKFFKPLPERASAQWLCDLSGIADRQLHNYGVKRLTLRSPCTCHSRSSAGWRFPSYRRDQTKQRLSMLLWRED